MLAATTAASPLGIVFTALLVLVFGLSAIGLGLAVVRLLAAGGHHG